MSESLALVMQMRTIGCGYRANMVDCPCPTWLRVIMHLKVAEVRQSQGLSLAEDIKLPATPASILSLAPITSTEPIPQHG